MSALRLLMVLAVLVSLHALTGCTGYRPPQIEIASTRIAEATSEGVVIEFILDARNDNDTALPLKSIDYRLSLDGREVFRGTRSPEATLRRNGQQQIRVPVAVRRDPAHPIAAGPQSYTLSGSITYLIPGKIAELLFDTEVRQPSANFSDSGTIEFPGT